MPWLSEAKKNRDKLHDLMLLGYTSDRVSRYYYLMVGLINLCVLLAACCAVALAARVWEDHAAELNFPTAPLWPTFAIGTAIMAMITLLNVAAILRTVRKAR